MSTSFRISKKKNKLTFGIVPYLNSVPFSFALKNKNFLANYPSLNISIKKNIPSLLWQELYNGNIDIAILPAVVYLKNRKDLRLIPNVGISSYGKCESVKMYFKKTIEDVKKVHLDPASNTSNLLLKIILQKRYKIHPKYISSTNRKYKNLKITTKNEGILTIGDKTFSSKFKGLNSIDIGEEWYHLTHLPCIFAIWACLKKSEVNTTSLSELLSSSIDFSFAHLDEVIDNEFKRLCLAKKFILNYLRKNIIYKIDKMAMRSLSVLMKYIGHHC